MTAVFSSRMCRMVIAVALVGMFTVGQARGTHASGDELQCRGVRGMVFLDANVDGVRNNGETGVAGVTVKLKNIVNKKIKQRVTNAQGGYQFAKPQQGTRRVILVLPPNFTTTSVKKIKVTVPPCQTVNFGVVADANPTTYYVDCVIGNDNWAGTTPATAWKTLVKANLAPLGPGKRLLFKRDCVWGGRLTANWHGTAGNPVTIGAYGTGALPVIQDDPIRFANVFITGSYQILENLHATLSQPPNPDANCNNQPVGGYWAGFNFARGAHHNTLRNGRATRMTMGVNIATDTHHNRVIGNQITDNNAMETLTRRTISAHDDKGAWGVLLHGSDNEIAFNYFANNLAHCTYDNGVNGEGNSVEIFEGVRNSIHHNVAVNDRVFSELGSSASVVTADNTFAYNRIVSNVRTARFIVVRGDVHDFGPTLRTRVYNNTVYLSGAQSHAVVCQHCAPNILTLRNNIIWAEEKAAYADAPFNESHNLYWNHTGKPLVQFLNFAMHSTSRIGNPRFVNAGGGDFRLLGESPGVNSGTAEVVGIGFVTDLNGVSVPQQGVVERGAYEYLP